MQVRRVRIENFRGFESLSLKPRGHVFLVGQPGAGRSDMIEALWRVLSPDSTRFALADDLDFFERDRTRKIEIEVVLGDLGPHLEQLFLDRLELWNADEGELIEEHDPKTGAPSGQIEHVVRLSYRAVWEDEQQQASQWVDFSKFADPEAEQFLRVPRLLREQIPFAALRSGGPVLSLGPRGGLRRLVDMGKAGDFAGSLDKLLEGISELAERLDTSKDLSTSLERIIAPLRVTLNLGDRSISDIVRFSPEGGSLAGVLRALAPVVKLADELGFIPVSRHGSTLGGMLELARAVAEAEGGGTVVVVDDYGESVDSLAAQHLASALRQKAAQLWLSTRTGDLGRAFLPQEITRLTVAHDGTRSVHHGPVPTTKAERIAARSLHLQLLPAVSARAVLLVEGPHDRIAMETAASMLNAAGQLPLPAARRIAVVDAAAADSAGGISAVPRLGQLARQLGFFVIALIDWDGKEEEAQQRLVATTATSDVVIRWPQGHAIERALVGDVEEGALRAALADVSAGFSVPLDFVLEYEVGAALRMRAMKFLKKSGGLHGPFLDSLPVAAYPQLMRRALEEVLAAVGKAGLIQL